MVVVTLDRMAAGGIYDHLGGGFHRYSVDAEWLVPHFEKMLYDNAMLAACYLEAWQATGGNDYPRVVRETLDYVLRDMTDPLGGSTARKTPTAKARKASSTSGRRRRCKRCSGPKRSGRLLPRLRRDHGRQFRRPQYSAPAEADRRLRQVLGRDPGSGPRRLEEELAADRALLLAARPAACGPAATTRCW